ncbi:MAG: hypothetical protein D8M57_02945 [Candidatus Scalindua sp. AMX11]|nr:MAG: hypothetical protein DWQ00_17045 [Candidatus Scalindua sp.]TDE66382.1 MAG: hypothetical protein D8M57_02945 [Candidatus Scalindua sp. AMX11]GJQ58227.1 MAG: hypothetical protein SCALA701_10280 [Candidatus Scalindua sp.]
MICKIPKITSLMYLTTMLGISIESYAYCCNQHNPVAYFCENVTSPDTVLGYKPVPDVSQYVINERGLPTSQGVSGKQENSNYLKWCLETFSNGGEIYAAYKEIAFNIKYTPEPEKRDFWQTPSETSRLKRGDCEDAVLLFFSRIPRQQKYAEIVWGWVFDRKSMVGKAHVWYQIKDKNGQSYVVEAFSQDWNGIIPVGVLERNGIRKPIFIIAHATISSLVNSLQKAVHYQKRKTGMDFFAKTSFGRGKTEAQTFSQEWSTLFSLTNSDLFERVINMQHKSRISTKNHRYFHKRNLGLNMKEISNILTKLHEVLSRYVNQKNATGTQVRGGSQRGETGHYNLTKNFICRR